MLPALTEAMRRYLAGEFVGRSQHIEDCHKRGIEDTVQHENDNFHGRIDIKDVNPANIDDQGPGVKSPRKHWPAAMQAYPERETHVEH